MKTYKVIFTTDTKGKDAETVIIQADKCGLLSVKGYRYYAFGGKYGTLKAVFTAQNVVAIYEV